MRLSSLLCLLSIKTIPLWLVVAMVKISVHTFFFKVSHDHLWISMELKFAVDSLLPCQSRKHGVFNLLKNMATFFTKSSVKELNCWLVLIVL